MKHVWIADPDLLAPTEDDFKPRALSSTWRKPSGERVACADLGFSPIPGYKRIAVPDLRCANCSEPIHQGARPVDWLHSHTDEDDCRTGDGSVAYPRATRGAGFPIGRMVAVPGYMVESVPMES